MWGHIVVDCTAIFTSNKAAILLEKHVWNGHAVNYVGRYSYHVHYGLIKSLVTCTELGAAFQVIFPCLYAERSLLKIFQVAFSKEFLCMPVIFFIIDVHVCRQSRTISEKSCCRTWSTSASATWDSSSCQRKGESYTKLRAAAIYWTPASHTRTHTHTHTHTFLWHLWPPGMQECFYSPALTC